MIDIIVPYYPSEQGEKELERLKQSLLSIPTGIEYNLIVAEGKNSVPKNMNNGLKQSKSRYFLRCDADVEFVTPNWLYDAMKFMEEHPDIGIIGFRIVLDNELENTGRIFKIEDNKLMSYDATPLVDPSLSSERNLVAGCCFLVDREINGYFSETLFPNPTNCDDCDYMMEVIAKGFKIWYLPIKVRHYEKNPNIKPSREKDMANLNHAIFAQRWSIDTG